MKLTRASVSGFAGSCLVLAVSACGSTSKGSGVNGGGDTAGSNSAAGSLNIGGFGAGANGSGASGSIDACAGDLVQAERIPLDMYVMLDVSGSMTEPTVGDPNVTKWQAVSSALSEFVKDPQSEGIGMGLQVFPIMNEAAPPTCTSDGECGTFGPCLNHACWPLINGELTSCLTDKDCQSLAKQKCTVLGDCSGSTDYVCDATATTVCRDANGVDHGACTAETSVCVSRNDCSPATYQNPAAAIATLPSGRDELVAVIEKAMPEAGGLTPTGPALTGALQQSSAWAKQHTDHQVVAVLATDGLPTLKTSGMSCAVVSSANDITAVMNVAGAGVASIPSISTFVIGVVSPDDVTIGAPDILDSIAMSGGTGKAFIVNTMNDVQAQFRDALNQIRAAGLACDLKVPAAEGGKTLDYGQVNVRFDDGSGSKTLGYVKDAKNCTSDGGWFYDVDPAAGAPQRILTCPATCAAFQATDMGSVKIELGCQTNVVK